MPENAFVPYENYIPHSSIISITIGIEEGEVKDIIVIDTINGIYWAFTDIKPITTDTNGIYGHFVSI